MSDTTDYGWNANMICIGQCFGLPHPGGWERKSSVIDMNHLAEQLRKEEFNAIFGKYIKPKKR